MSSTTSARVFTNLIVKIASRKVFMTVLVKVYWLIFFLRDKKFFAGSNPALGTK